jgi:hypothetical protein
MILQKYRRQLSDKAVTVDHGGQPFFVPLSFEHKDVTRDLVNIEFPKWFLDKHKQTLEEIEFSTNLLIERLCDQG